MNIENPPVVLAISGLDPTGSAGLIADVRVMSELGCHPCGVVTCETVQTSAGLTGVIPSKPNVLDEQLHVLINDLEIKAVKIGALGSVEVIEKISSALDKIPGVPVILDPVFAPTEGPSFINSDGISALSHYLLRRAFIATPNLKELGFPAGLEIDSGNDDMILGAASGWLASGVENVLVTGLVRDGKMVDRLVRFSADGVPVTREFSHPKHDVGEVHGTGCVLASSITSFIALGEKTMDAVTKGCEYTSRVIGNAGYYGDGAAFWNSVGVGRIEPE